MGCDLLMIRHDYINVLPPASASVLGRYYHDAGAYVEALVAPHIGQLLGTRVDPSFEKANTGLDDRHLASDAKTVAIEVKSAWSENTDVKGQLQATRQGAQMSDEWLKGKVENPEDTYKVVVQVNMVTETLNVFLMTDDRGWNEDPVLEAPLEAFGW